MPHLGPDVTLNNPAFIHDTALIHGKVHLGPEVSIWPHVVMRAEMYEIRIGARSNIQDFVMIHVGIASPTIIGEDCSITHHATLPGCDIGDRCLIGINATIMDGAKVGENSIVAGHTIIPENKAFPPNSVIAGVPGKVVATRDCGDANRLNAQVYSACAAQYSQGVDRLSDEALKQFVSLAKPAD